MYHKLPLLASLALIPIINTYATSAQKPFSMDASVVLGPEIDVFVNSLLKEWNSPGGLSIAVVRKDGHDSWKTETKGYGLARADGTEMSPDSLFCIASNSKLFNVLATGLLISNETLSPRISWDTKIASIVPDWEIADSTGMKEATIIDVMSHRTGLPRHDLMYGKFDTVKSIISRLKYLRPSAGFRETWQYNNCMYMLLSYLQPTLVDTGFALYVQKNIFEPLGLHSTTYSYAVAKASGNLADGFGREGINKTENLFGRGTPRKLLYPNAHLPDGDEGNFKDGAGGVIMSASDAATWLKALLLEGRNPVTNDSVIPAEVIQKAASGITVQSGRAALPELSPTVYGGGQGRGTYRGHEIIEHGGSTTGYMTQITRLPWDGFGVAVFSNDDTYGSSILEIAKLRIIDEILGLTPIGWSDRLKSVHIQTYNAYIADAKPRPSNTSSPTSSFEALTGIYRHLGYGDIELCLHDSSSQSQQSETCQKLLSEAHVLLPGRIKSNVPTFIANWDKFWSSHFTLEHFDGNLFNASALDSRPALDDPKQLYWTASATEESIVTAEFDFTPDGSVIGFGVTGGLWGSGSGVGEPVGTTVKERAEVFFEKI